MWAFTRIAALLWEGSGCSRLPAAYLLYSTHTHREAWLNKNLISAWSAWWSASLCVQQACRWSSAAMCDQTFMAATFGPCDSCSKASPLMNIYIKSEAINYCSFCVEMVKRRLWAAARFLCKTSQRCVHPDSIKPAHCFGCKFSLPLKPFHSQTPNVLFKSDIYIQNKKGLFSSQFVSA